MVYKEKFVAVIKESGKILREIEKETVMLPFGSEYSILLKNKHCRKASVQVEIDGQDVLFGKSLILEPNSDLELERFLENMDSGNKFRFIRKTEKIQKHRGDRPDDGLIRIEFAFEKLVPWTTCSTYYTYPCNFNINMSPPFYNTTLYNATLSSSPSSNSSSSGNNNSFISSCSMNQISDCGELSKPLEDEGITVEGSNSQQKFTYGYIGQLEEPEVIILRLKGHSNSKDVKQAVTVNKKLTCSSCGKKHKPNIKFCFECGTRLKF